MNTKRKVILYIATSLDGFIAEKDGGLNWLESFPHIEGEDYGYADLMSRIDTTLMGTGTYKIIEDFNGPFPILIQKTTFLKAEIYKARIPFFLFKNMLRNLLAN